MERFAFIVHPIDVKKDLAKKLPIARYLPESVVEKIMLRKEPGVVAEISGIRSLTGAQASGWLIGLPLSPRQFVELPLELVYDKIEKCGHIAEDLGAGIIGLGAFSSVAGDGGITLSSKLKISVTTGNSYTTYTAIEGAIRGAELMGIELSAAIVAVVGATGSIGATCAESLAREAKEVVLVGRDESRLETLIQRLRPISRASIRSTTDIAGGLKAADIIITVSSAAKAIVLPEHIKRGAVVCDVARPRDVSVAVAKTRNDVLVIEGGLVRVPGDMKCTDPKTRQPFSFGFPPGTAYACMAETMALSLEGDYRSFTLGKEVTIDQTDEIGAIATKHGFRLEGFRSFERAVSEAEISAIRENAGRSPLNLQRAAVINH